MFGEESGGGLFWQYFQVRSAKECCLLVIGYEICHHIYEANGSRVSINGSDGRANPWSGCLLLEVGIPLSVVVDLDVSMRVSFLGIDDHDVSIRVGRGAD